MGAFKDEVHCPIASQAVVFNVTCIAKYEGIRPLEVHAVEKKQVRHFQKMTNAFQLNFNSKI